jgi:hypothetical protein
MLVKSMQRHAVQSSALNSAGYDPAADILKLEFRDSGGVWQYFGFSKASFKNSCLPIHWATTL